MPLTISRRAFNLPEVVMASALLGLLLLLAVGVFVPLARSTRRAYRRSDLHQQTEAALDRMTRMIEASKPTAVRVYENRPKPEFLVVLQTQAMRDVGPEARTIWSGEVEFLAWVEGALRYWRVPQPLEHYPGLRPYQPTNDAQFAGLLADRSVLICAHVKKLEIQGYSERGSRYPLTLVLETELPPEGQEKAHTFKLQTKARPLIRHGL